MNKTTTPMRLLALVLCLCMVLGMAPAITVAAEETGYTVEIDGMATNYTDFFSAINAACGAEAAILTLYQDVQRGYTWFDSGNVTLDLNGKTVHDRISVCGGTLTVTDTAETKGTVENYAGCAFDYESGKLIILDTTDCCGEADGHEAWLIGRVDETAADAGTIGSTGTEDIVIPAGCVAQYVYTNTDVDILPDSDHMVELHRHTLFDATCIAPGICTSCGATVGEALDHSYNDDGICTVCGASEKLITINMADSYGDGWDGNGIAIYTNGEYMTTVTLEDGEAGVWTGEYFPAMEYEFYWVQGSYPEECSFEILIGEEVLFEASTTDCSTYSEGYRFYPVCEHSYDIVGGVDSTCTEDGYTTYECSLCSHTYTEYYDATGHDLGEDGICTACGYAADNFITIKMYDNCGNGWTGNIIVLSDSVEGSTFITLEDGEAGVWVGEYDPSTIKNIFWSEGDGSEECAFEILIDGELLHKAEFGDCYYYYHGFRFYPVCAHDLVQFDGREPTCTEAGYANYQCNLCGNRYHEERAPLNHDFGEDGSCTVCGAEKNSIIINLYDAGEDGWSGNAIEVYANGEYVATVTMNDGSTEVWKGSYDPSVEYEFYWVKGNYSYECSFEIMMGVDKGFTATRDDCFEFDDNYRFFPVCEHSYTLDQVVAPTCTDEGYTVYKCGTCNDCYETDYVDATDHSFSEEDSCTVCGARKFIVVFFRNNLMWTDVRVQYTGSEYCEDTTDSGVPMEFYYNDGTYDFYAAEIPFDVETLHFTGLLNDALQVSPDDYYYKWLDGYAFYVNGSWLWYGRFDSIGTCDHKYNHNPDKADCYNAWYCSVCDDTVKAAAHSLGGDGICTVCGLDSNSAIVINMKDGYGDGWNDGAIKIYADGELEYTVTFDDGETATWMGKYDPEKEYEFYWVEGSFDYECSFTVKICGEKVFSATEGDCEYFPDGYRFFPVCEHIYGEGDVIAPSCVDDGFTLYSCTLCGIIEFTDYVSALGHTKGEEEGVVTAPTCTEQGYTTYTCAVCGESYDSDYVSALGHTKDEGVVTAPNCYDWGYTTYTCTACGESFDDDYAAALGHVLGEDGNCTVCGDRYGVPVFVAGVEVTIDNMADILGDGTASYDLATNTLTLNGFVYEGEDEGIYSAIPLNIVLIGENSITSSEYMGVCFYVVGGEINISGTGSLTIYSNDDGIFVNAMNDVDMTISDSVTIDISPANDEGIYLFGSTVDLLIKDNVKLTIGTEDAPNEEECIYIDGVSFGSVSIFGNADIHLVTTDEEGIYVDGEFRTINIFGGNIYINADEEGMDAGTINIFGGTVETYGGEGMEGIYADNLTIAGGTVIVGGKEQAIEADNITIMGGTVTVTEGGIIAAIWDDNTGTYTGPGAIHLLGMSITELEGAAIGTIELEDVGTATAVLNADGTYADAFVICPTEEPVKNGIYEENGSLYYYKDGELNYAGLIEIDGSYYYVRGTGEVVNNRSYWITKTNGLKDEGTYEFAADGKMIVPEPVVEKNGIYRENGKLYYYVDGAKNYAGLIQHTGDLIEEDGTVIKGAYNNDLIYVRGTGELAIGSYWTTKNNGLKASDTYRFDENGKMMMLNGIIAEDGSLYYYVDGLRNYAGLIEIDGSLYYVRGNGEVVNGRSYWITKTNGLEDEGTYEFAADGKMIVPEPVAEKNGVYREGGKLMYYVDGELNYAGLIRHTGDLVEEDGTVIKGVYDNAYIYVRGTGELVFGRSYWTTKHNGEMKAATYQFDENGIMQNPAV